MFRKYITLFVLLFGISCSTIDIKENVHIINGVDARLAPYVDSFIKASKGAIDKSNFKGMDIQFGNLSGSAAGMCYITPFGKKILIDKFYWNWNFSNKEREELIFHEFGHCVLYRPHTKPTSIDGVIGWFERTLFNLGILREKKGFFNDGCPSSYMHPTVLRKSCINAHYDYYMEELFNQIIEVEIVEEIDIIEYSCARPIVVNKTREWNKQDRWSLNRAVYVCRDEYKSCLSVFTKKSKHAYTAVCRRPESN